MTLGERIRQCRQKAGMSQEKVAELAGVSRQAVTKWEADRSAPNTGNLFRLAEIFGTTVDLLLDTGETAKPSPAEQLYHLFQLEAEENTARRKKKRKRNIAAALAVCSAYLLVYLIGRIIWCDFSESTFLGWLAIARPSGDSSYLYGWLLSSNLFWIAMAISAVPALFGKVNYAVTTFGGFVTGMLLGILFGPNPEGAATGHSHFGWAIWGAVYCICVAVGVIVEQIHKKAKSH